MEQLPSEVALCLQRLYVDSPPRVDAQEQMRMQALLQIAQASPEAWLWTSSLIDRSMVSQNNRCESGNCSEPVIIVP